MSAARIAIPDVYQKEQAEAALLDCRMCPRNCGVNRHEKKGQCMIGSDVVVDVVAPHFGEEASIQGTNGSGTVFFSGCNLRCVFCQNWDISHKVRGYNMTPRELATWMMKLQEASCHNINFVTPEHVTPQVALAILEAREMGLELPIVYNTSAYDCAESLRLMEGLVDIYLPDFKLWDNKSSARFLKAENYPETAKAAIKEMHRQVGFLRFSPEGIAKSGLLVRHLAMPGREEEGAEIMRWLAALHPDTYVHIMEQYFPQANVGKEDVKRDGTTHERYGEINRGVKREEIDYIMKVAREAGLRRFEEPHGFETIHS
ncbi:putative pyruvate formate lyase activating enzyme [Planoprotostelium fungivorum]|uniref:Putative pyruvate formate lyase activating enzyme n=1 Tax=Planoprotostelium fungivorum TaxID=1890364 RepID=A0A2P6NG25_9EUKA|nr:putative pyruvate formate lyase activating enzyme [Planoprotostelium fungivorum]